MSIKIKKGALFVNDNGQMKDTNMLVGDTAENIKAINEAGQSKVSEIEAKGQEFFDKLPDDYGVLAEDVTTLKQEYILDPLIKSQVEQLNQQ